MAISPDLLSRLYSSLSGQEHYLQAYFDDQSLFPRIDLGFLHSAVGGVIVTSLVIITFVSAISLLLSQLAEESTVEDY